MINRYSSRTQRLDRDFLSKKLENAMYYDRIAGFFSSSIIEVAGENLNNLEKTRIICNSWLSREDVMTATAARNGLWKEWCSNNPEIKYANAKPRLKKLFELLRSGKMEIKVLTSDIFGLIHGKAGVITMKDGKKTSFIGSINESLSAWEINYEIVWEDDSEEAVKWVQDEFDHFWESPYAVPLSDAVIEDISRLSGRIQIDDIDEWRKEPDVPSIAVESPVYRRELGLWEHQKYFVDIAFNAHKKSHGARFVLADMVGLGKTVQLAMSAQLMALLGDRPILVIVPKTLLWQWQDELYNLLDIPSAIWAGNHWVDENDIRYPYDIRRCPRRIGIISQGLIIGGRDEYKDQLLSMEYECVIVDEAHKARRANLGIGKENERPRPQNLMEFLLKISQKTKSMLLATATPVQIYPIECWDLLNILSQKNNSVLGSQHSKWRKEPKKALDLIMKKDDLSDISQDYIENCEWLRDPFPPAEEDLITFGDIRKRLSIADDEFVISPGLIYNNDNKPLRRKIERIFEHGFIDNSNPFIRHIIRRTRDFLENNIDPETNEPYLKKIEVVLMGEKDEDAILLPSYLKQAYTLAEEFCRLYSKRIRGPHYMRVMLLKRVGSTMIAGQKTAERMLEGKITEDFEEDEEFDEIEKYSADEKRVLSEFAKTLMANKDKDPKYILLTKLLFEEGFADRGCIIFSQYYDSIYWVAENLSDDYKDLTIGLYAGGDKSGYFLDGKFHKKHKDEIKRMVKDRLIKVMVGTDAASEGLNLQTLSSLVNIDLPWNPTRLEQRKGRIQRIGQEADKIYIYNMRYKDSVEDRVHNLLSERFQNISSIFGQLPDVLEDVWVNVALDEKAEAEKIIDAVPEKHPFELRYEKQAIGHTDWESCRRVLDQQERKKPLLLGWK